MSRKIYGNVLGMLMMTGLVLLGITGCANSKTTKEDIKVPDYGIRFGF
jgi:hypothetical protein